MFLWILFGLSSFISNFVSYSLKRSLMILPCFWISTETRSPWLSLRFPSVVEIDSLFKVRILFKYYTLVIQMSPKPTVTLIFNEVDGHPCHGWKRVLGIFLNRINILQGFTPPVKIIESYDLLLTVAYRGSMPIIAISSSVMHLRIVIKLSGADIRAEATFENGFKLVKHTHYFSSPGQLRKYVITLVYWAIYHSAYERFHYGQNK